MTGYSRGGRRTLMKTDKVELSTWQHAREWCDHHGVIKPSYAELINSRAYPPHAFSMGQLCSKFWMLEWLDALNVRSPHTVAILGSWIGSFVSHLHDRYRITRTYGIDCDAHSVELSEQFNQQLVQQNWSYKGVVADVNQLDCAHMQFETGGELIEVTPNWIINTSAEHMSTDWFHTVRSDQLIIMQTNSNPELEGHINTVHSVQQLTAQFPMSKPLMVGEMCMPTYTRYMQIGYR